MDITKGLNKNQKEAGERGGGNFKRTNANFGGRGKWQNQNFNTPNCEFDCARRGERNDFGGDFYQ